MVMDYEPLAKRRRTASPPLLQEIDNNIQQPVPPQNRSQPGGDDDKTYQLHLERAFADPRFRSTLAQIFDKYGQKIDNANEEAIDPALCEFPTQSENLMNTAVAAHMGAPEQREHLTYPLGVLDNQSRHDESANTDYGADRLNQIPGSYISGFPAPPYIPNVPDGIQPGLAQGWYSNPFQAAGPCLPIWDGANGQFDASTDPAASSGPWMTPNGFVYPQASWAALPAPAQPAPAQPVAAPPCVATSQPPPATEQPPPADAVEKEEPTQVEKNIPASTKEDESTDSFPDGFTPDGFDHFRRRPIQPRYSKNGKRLGRPPKDFQAGGATVSSSKDGNDSGAYDGEGEDNSVADLKPAGELADDDSDSLWSELAEALRLSSQATSKKRPRQGAKPTRKGENSATESDGAADVETDGDKDKADDTSQDRGKAEAMLRRIQKQLIDRAVRRSTMAEEPETAAGDAEAEGRRRSGRERKRVDFGEQVSWDRVSAERRASYKITMHLRALTTQARRERKKKEKEEAEKAAKEKKEAEELAAAAKKDEPAPSDETALPSTIPDSQDSVMTLTLRPSPKKPQSNTIMRQTIKNHVNSVVHFEEDDEALLEDSGAAAVPITKPVFSKPKQPAKPAITFLGENYIDTVYALSDDEAPALLDSLARVTIGGKKKQVPAAGVVPRPKARATSPEDKGKSAEENAAGTSGIQPKPSNEPSISTRSDFSLLQVDPAEDTTQSGSAAAESSEGREKPLEPDNTARPAPNGGDGNDSGIDIPSEQNSTDQPDIIQHSRRSANVEPTFQDPDLLGAEDLLDSLDVMSGTEDMPSSPIMNHEFETEQPQEEHSSAEAATTESGYKEPLFVDREPVYDSMDILEDVEGEMPFVDHEQDMPSIETADTFATEPSNAAGDPTTPEDPFELPPSPKPIFTFVAENPEEDVEDMDESPQAPRPRQKKVFISPPRRPLPQHARPKPEDRRSSSASKSVTPKLPSPGISAERPRQSSTRSSQTAAPSSRLSSTKKRSSSSRHSLLSLIGGGEEGIESLMGRRSTTTQSNASPVTSPVTPAALPMKKASSSSRSRSKASASSSSSLTRMSLSSFSGPHSRDKHRSSKERKEAKARRRKSEGATASSANAELEVTGKCGVDGYTCGRDFCFTCI